MATNNTAALTPKQFAVLAELLAGKRINAAAVACGVSVRSVSRWMSEPAFLAELAKERGQLTTEIGMQVMAGAGAAFRTLANLCQVSEDEAIRLRSAVAILSLAMGTLADIERDSELALHRAQIAELKRRNTQ